MNIPDDNIVSLLKSPAEDEEVDVSACKHGGPCIIEPSGGWSHWSKPSASFTCCIVGFFIWESVDDCCWSIFPLIVVDNEDSLRFDIEFSVFNFDKPLPRRCLGKLVATVFGGGWL